MLVPDEEPTLSIGLPFASYAVTNLMEFLNAPCVVKVHKINLSPSFTAILLVCARVVVPELITPLAPT